MKPGRGAPAAPNGWGTAGDESPGSPRVPRAPSTGLGKLRSEVPVHSGRAAKSSGSTVNAERVYKERVLVRVYDLGQTVFTRWHNQLTKSYGAFHSGVEVYGREWSFGMTFDNFSTGVTWNIPAQNPDHSFRETLCMGYTTCSPRQVISIIEEMKYEWKGCTYNVLTRNCHHFSDALCLRLGVARVPPWVNDLAGTGAQTMEFLDSADSGYDGGSALLDFFGAMKSKVYNAFVGEQDGQRTAGGGTLRQRSLVELQRQQLHQEQDSFSVVRRR